MRLTPSKWLVLLAAVVALPCLTLAVWAGSGGVLFLLLLAVGLALVFCDAWISRRRVHSLSVDVDPVVQASVGTSLELVVRVTNRGAEIPSMRMGLSLPVEFHASDGPVVAHAEPFGAEKVARLALRLTALRRGRYSVDECHLETPSAWRLWLIRRTVPVEVELRIYPDLRAERRKLSALFLHRGNDGLHAVRQVGKGREFEQLREYLPGDDYGDIDWKATSRQGLPVTRTFQIERTQEVYVVVDHSRLSAREIKAPLEATPANRNADLIEHGNEEVVTTQLEAFLKSALVLSSVAQQQGDLFGFVGFGKRVDRFIRSGGGTAHYQVVRDSAYTMEPEAVAPDFEELMVTLRQRLTRRALLILLVDLSDPLTAESFYDSVQLISRQHLVLVNMVRPLLARPMFSVNDDSAEIDDIYRDLGGHLQWRDLRETAQKLRRIGVEMTLPHYAELSAEAVGQYMRVKRRQML